MKISQCNFSNIALGKNASAFLTEVGVKEASFDFILFLHNNGSLLFCFTVLSSYEWLDFAQTFLQTNLKNTAGLLLPSASRYLLKCNVVLA